VKFNFLPPKGGRVERSHKVHATLDSLSRLQARASGFSFLPQQPLNSLLAGRHASRLRGRGLNFDEIRHYLPGDDVRCMDWKVTARMRKPHVRVYTEERDRSVLLIVDQRRTMFFGSRRCMKSVAAAEVAALAAWKVLDSGDRLGGLVFNDERMDWIAPHGSRQRVMHFLGRLVELNQALSIDVTQETNAEQLDEALKRISQLAKHDCLVIVVTDGFGVSEETVRLAARIQQRNDLIWIRIFDQFESELPNVGRANFSLGPTRMTVDTSTARLRERFGAQFEEQMAWARNSALRAEVPHIPIDAGKDVAWQIRRLLGQGGLQ